jgi:predicted methyltransferase
MDKEKAMGRAKKLHLREMKEVESTIDKLDKKMAVQDQIRKQTIKLKKNEMREKNNIWEQKRVNMKNEALTIKHEDYQQLVPAQYKPKTFSLDGKSPKGDRKGDSLGRKNNG